MNMNRPYTNSLRPFLFFTLILFASLSYSQQTIWEEDFETCGNTVNCNDSRYTSEYEFFRMNTVHDYWGRVNATTKEYYLTNSSSGKKADAVSDYQGQHGDYYYAGEDLDNTNLPRIGNADGSDIKVVNFAPIDISGKSELEFKGLFARGENDLCGQSTYDPTDYIKLFYSIDGGPEVLGMCFNSIDNCQNGSAYNNPLVYDPNCDGDGSDGTMLSETFQEFSFNIPNGSALNLRIEVHMDGGSEEIAFDYFRVISNALLPVQLVSFTANAVDKDVLLNWETKQETNNKEFSLLRSQDGENWYSIATLAGMGTSEVTSKYSFLDDDPFTGINYYRLKQIDFDGGSSLSSIVSIETNSKGLKVFPNPVRNGRLFVNGSTSNNYSIFNSIGTIVKKGELDASPLDISDLLPGTYYLQITNSPTTKVVVLE